MNRLGRYFLLGAVLLGITHCQVAHAQVKFIDPTVDITPPTISFDANINPVPGTLSGDALNIIRAHRVALQQVQAAIQYLHVHRTDILAGENTWYNENFGDFYDPNSPFAGLYNRILKHDTGKVDKFGNPIYEDWYNTEHYDRVLLVFTRIQTALKNAITYAWGAQTGNAANAAIFDNYRSGTNAMGLPNPNGLLTIGDPLFGSPNTPDKVTPLPIDPLTGTTLIDPVTMLPYVNPPLVGDPLVSHFSLALPASEDRGSVQWGDSTSFSPLHLAQLANNPNKPLSWDDDNATGGKLTADQQLAFFKDRLDAYAVQNAPTATTPGNNTIYVGGAFLNESQRSNSTVPGQPNPFFHPTEFNQYQQIIMALAQSAGSDPVSTGGTTGTSNGPTVSIENGISELMGQSAYFFQALDGKSYASFSDLFKPVQEGGIGDGSLLPPPGKQAGRSSNFIPLVPSS
jgi:hypothetical protein